MRSNWPTRAVGELPDFSLGDLTGALIACFLTEVVIAAVTVGYLLFAGLAARSAVNAFYPETPSGAPDNRSYLIRGNFIQGVTVSQAQINALSEPMLWYVQQSVPDPSCLSTGVVACPTVSALMPQVYLPPNWSAMSAGGNITGQNVSLEFNQGGQGSILNTGNIAASNTLTVNTGTLTN